LEISDLFVVRLRWVRRESRGSIRAHSQGTSIFGCWPSAMHRNHLAAHSPAQSTSYSTHSAQMQALREKQSGIQHCVCNKGESDTLHLRYTQHCARVKKRVALSAALGKRRESRTQSCMRKRGEIGTKHRVSKRGEGGVQHCMCEQKETSTLTFESILARGILTSSSSFTVVHNRIASFSGHDTRLQYRSWAGQTEGGARAGHQNGTVTAGRRRQQSEGRATSTVRVERKQRDGSV
jgi:hypothetical protein